MMLASNRRGMFVIYILLSVAIFTIALSGAVSALASVALIAALMGFVLMTGFSNSWAKWRVAVPRVSASPRITEAAIKAAHHAPRESEFLSAPYLLQDVGLIIDERGRNGLKLRWARFTSLDDESIRPYIVVHVPPDDYPYQSIVRFEMTDANGHPQFIYEMDYRLRPGENLILPDYRLRLNNNEKLGPSGPWKLSIAIDGQVIGLHRFNLLPAMADRLRSTREDGEVDRTTRLMAEREEALPLSLEELLNKQSS